MISNFFSILRKERLSDEFLAEQERKKKEILESRRKEKPEEGEGKYTSRAELEAESEKRREDFERRWAE